MRPKSTKSSGSLRQRLLQIGLDSLTLAQRLPRPKRQPLPVHPPSLAGWRGSILLLLILAAVVLPAASRRFHPSATLTAMPYTLPASRLGVPVLLAPDAILATDQNIEDLAQILMSEASPLVANATERRVVGLTVINRLRQLHATAVREVWYAYAHHAVPNGELRQEATRLLRHELPDISLGATHFYSPQSMPKEGDSVAGFDVSGGLEQTSGMIKKNYRPGWATHYDRVTIKGVRTSHFKFYRQPAVP